MGLHASFPSHSAPCLRCRAQVIAVNRPSVCHTARHPVPNPPSSRRTPPPPNPRSAVTTIKSNGRRSPRRISPHPLLSHRGRIGPPLPPVHFPSTGNHHPHRIWPERHCYRHSSVSAATHLIPFDTVQASPPSSSPDAIGTHWSTIAH
jgi:hypothetical protein